MFILFWRSAWRRFGWENTYLFLFLFIKIWGSDKLIKIDLNNCRIYKKNQTKLFSTIWFFSITNCFLCQESTEGKISLSPFDLLYQSCQISGRKCIRNLQPYIFHCLPLPLARLGVCVRYICLACFCGLLSTLCALFALLAFVAC